MKKWKRFITYTWPVPVLFLFFFSACISHAYRPDPGLVRTLDKTELLNFPASYRMVHRVRLHIRKRSYDFTGYLAVRGNCWRAAAISELGGTVFDLLGRGAERKVIKRPRRFPVKPLKHGVLGELGYIFASPGSLRYGTGSAGKTGAKITIKTNGKPTGEEKTRETRKAGEIDRQVSILLIRDGLVHSEIDIESFRYVAGWSYPVPDRFRVSNRYWGYMMQVELIRMDMRPVGEDVFAVE